MSEKPLLMSGELVRAILNGSKSVTRRPIRPQPPHRERCDYVDGQWVWSTPGLSVVAHLTPDVCCKPRFQSGDVAWVRETWRVDPKFDDHKPSEIPELSLVEYLADDEPPFFFYTKARPSIFMPRWVCRLRLKIVDVWPERLQEITEEDARLEGVDPKALTLPITTYRAAFQAKWAEIYGEYDGALWVWRYEFEVVK